MWFWCARCLIHMPVPDLPPELYTHFIFFLPHFSTLMSDRDLKLSMSNSKLLISLPPRSALPPGSLINPVCQTKNLRCTLDSVLEGSKFYLTLLRKQNFLSLYPSNILPSSNYYHLSNRLLQLSSVKAASRSILHQNTLLTFIRFVALLSKLFGGLALHLE